MVQAIERVWDFYFELFGQRQSQFGDWLLGCDRIALDCYQAAYIGLRHGPLDPGPAAVLVHAHRVLARHVPPRASRCAGSGGSSTRSR